MLFGGRAPGGFDLADTWEFDGANWSVVPTAAAPSRRSNHELVHHASIGRVVLFGGADAAGVELGDTWSYDGANWGVVSTATSPGARARHAMVYDPVRGRTVLFGGGATTTRDDTWEFDGTNWVRVFPATVPQARADAVMAFDAVQGRCVLFGGLPYPSSGVRDSLTDAWHYDGQTWRPYFPPWFGALAHDSRRGRTVFANAETWELDGAGWRQVLPTGPAPDLMVFDAARGVCVGFASQTATTTSYDGVRWRSLATPVAPPARSGAAMSYDSVRERVVLFGGSSSSPLADTWEFDGAAWSQVTTASAPAARLRHAIAFDSRRARTVLFGGNSGAPQGYLADTWEYDGGSWAQRTASLSPPPRESHTLTFDPVRGQTLLVGGTAWNGSLADSWAWDGTAWLPQGTILAVSGHAATYDSTRLRAVAAHGVTWVYGHNFSFSIRNDVLELPPSPSATWTRHGQGCAGGAGVPSLDRVGSAVPALGSSFPVQVTSLPAQPGAVYLAVGFGIAQWNGVALPQRLGLLGMPGCAAWIAPEPGLGPVLVHGGGSLPWQLGLPNAAVLRGVLVALQALVLDPAAPGGVGSLSNAGLALLR